MKQEIQLRYLNAELNIGLVSWKEAYLLSSNSKTLLLEVYKGRLIYREKGSPNRISYIRLKKGLVKMTKTIIIEVPSWMSDISPKPSHKNKKP